MVTQLKVLKAHPDERIRSIPEGSMCNQDPHSIPTSYYVESHLGKEDQ